MKFNWTKNYEEKKGFRKKIREVFVLRNWQRTRSREEVWSHSRICLVHCWREIWPFACRAIIAANWVWSRRWSSQLVWRSSEASNNWSRITKQLLTIRGVFWVAVKRQLARSISSEDLIFGHHLLLNEWTVFTPTTPIPSEGMPWILSIYCWTSYSFDSPETPAVHPCSVFHVH